MQIVAYYRVSTKGQGESGLGLEAQRAAVQEHAKASGASIIREFIEVESGKRADNRPQLQEALPFAKRAGAVLVVAKLDRLARNVRFLATLMESGVEFTACDLPMANRLTLHIMAAVAEAEAGMISARTKAALAAAKARGQLLGSARPDHWQGREQSRIDGGVIGLAAAVRNIKARAIADYADLLPTIKAQHQAGLSLRQIAASLNASGQRTRQGAAFSAMQVKRILERSA